MDYVLSGLRWKICLLYLDDVIVFSKTFEDHVDQLGQVLTRHSDAGLKVAPKKCHFFSKSGRFSWSYCFGPGYLYGELKDPVYCRVAPASKY